MLPITNTKTTEELIDTSCCPLQYSSQNSIICYKKNKFNQPFYVKGPNGPVKWRYKTFPQFFNNGFAILPSTRNQNGRWNHSLQNTKLFAPNGVRLNSNGDVIGYTQTKNLFKNTDYKMNKRELFSYLSRNRKYLNR